MTSKHPIQPLIDEALDRMALLDLENDDVRQNALEDLSSILKIYKDVIPSLGRPMTDEEKREEAELAVNAARGMNRMERYLRELETEIETLRRENARFEWLKGAFEILHLAKARKDAEDQLRQKPDQRQF